MTRLYSALRVAAALTIVLGHAPASAESVEASRAIRAGTVVEAGDLVLSDREARRGEARSFDEVVGMEVRRSIYRGRPIRLSDLGPPTLVRRNDLVEIVYRRGSLTIRGEGRSMRDGGRGERVRVMNLDSRMIVTGRVVDSGRVEVSP